MMDEVAKVALPEDVSASNSSSDSTSWAASKEVKLVVFTLSTLSLVVALDATILVCVLPVSLQTGDNF